MDIRIAVTGFGNVGQGLATLLDQHSASWAEQYGVRLLLTGAADRGGAVASRDGLDLRSLLAAKRDSGSVAAYGGHHAPADRFLRQSGATILVEAASTNFEDAEPGWSYIKTALAADMDVVLASKGSMALYWDELTERARSRRRLLGFSATVGAPLPTLQIADRALTGVTITGFEGILNGTSHQILSSMGEGASYDDGVRKAQEIGIAETDPTLDVDGWDAAAKALILANALLGAHLRLADVAREGIRGVTSEDLRAAASAGQAIKPVARAHRTEHGVEASVRPERRSLGDPLGRLHGDGMGIILHTHPLGPLSITSEPEAGGGGISTAMATLRDIFNIARDRGWMTTAP